MTPEIQALAADPEIAPLVAPTYMRKSQRDEHRAEIDAIKAQLNDPAERKKLHNPGRLAQDIQRREKNLQAQTPPPLTASQRDKIARLSAATANDFREGMVSAEELRSRPAGVVDRQVAWQTGKKKSVLLWKRAQILLNPDSDARDLCNAEKFRPSHPGSRNLMTDGLIPRVSALSPEAKINYDKIDWSSPEVRAEIQRLIDEGKVRINTQAKESDRRAPKSTAGSDCRYCQRPFHGGFHKANRERHEKTCDKRGDLVGAKEVA